jgi:peptidyl-prolyl cis-trans isomerase SurA
VVGIAASVLFLSGVLSGCGVAGTSFHPGVAAQVGDDRITVSEVDDVASSYCSAIKEQLSGEKQVLPLRYLRAGIAGQLVLVAAAQQLADKYSVEPGVAYDQKVAELQGAVGTLPESQQDAVIEIESSATYINGVKQAVGEQLLADKGEPNPTSDQAVQAGQRAFTTWLAGQDVTIDPQFGVEIKDGQAVPVDTSLSYAAGDTAKNGNAGNPDPGYAASLPASHRCG